ncbi:hypothetical protein CANMA_001141 [Candida margitis]|uniref:uncharacterized protein n=1 Tax=Candida margitis TaxID=1775924 RepID=UPI002226E536|nr:uncharacterized protein CANMA_001141 [Candida margitis]KAI5969851.1 hypothetical protein CANMA_001141 [Candida margitis]
MALAEDKTRPDKQREMKKKQEFPTKEGTTVPGFYQTDPLSELPDVKTLPNARHRYDIPVIIFHNLPTSSSGTILLSDLTEIKQRTCVKANETAYIGNLPQCRLENKAFSKNELFTVKLKHNFDSYLKIFQELDRDIAIARINFDLYKYNNKNYEGWGNSCRIVYKKNLAREMLGIEQEFINFIDRLKACVSREYFKKLDQQYGLKEFVKTFGVSDEDIDNISQNPTFLQSQTPNEDTDEDKTLNNSGGSSPISSINDVSFISNPPSVQNKKDSVMMNVESQVPAVDDDEAYSDEDFDVEGFATAPTHTVADSYSISQDIDDDNAPDGVLATHKSTTVCQFATVTHLKNTCKSDTSHNDLTTYVIDVVNSITMVPEVPLVIKPLARQSMEFSSFKLHLNDSNGNYVAAEFSHYELCRFLGIQSVEELHPNDLQRVKKQFAKLLCQNDVKNISLKRKTKILNRGIKLKTWHIESKLEELA